MSTTLEGTVDFLDMRRLALELGTPGDHDISYKFTLPTSVSQTLDWAKLLAMVHQGEL
jgi:hypothetical protein